jgi:ABC-type glycerol-3-phosphate transport system permease component
MAASTIATWPIALLFAFVQKYFIKGLTAAAVKG